MSGRAGRASATWRPRLALRPTAVMRYAEIALRPYDLVSARQPRLRRRACAPRGNGSQGDWLSGRAPRSHRGGHWFDPSIAHHGFVDQPRFVPGLTRVACELVPLRRRRVRLKHPRGHAFLLALTDRLRGPVLSWRRPGYA